jgi:hypothetical protein
MKTPEHVVMTIEVESIQAERYFSYRGHPYAIAPNVDYPAEPTTLVEFTLEEVAAGTELTIVESGFDRIPEARRAEAFRMNEGGWSEQAQNVERNVTQQA